MPRTRYHGDGGDCRDHLVQPYHVQEEKRDTSRGDRSYLTARWESPAAFCFGEFSLKHLSVAEGIQSPPCNPGDSALGNDCIFKCKRAIQTFEENGWFKSGGKPIYKTSLIKKKHTHTHTRKQKIQRSKPNVKGSILPSCFFLLHLNMFFSS